MCKFCVLSPDNRVPAPTGMRPCPISIVYQDQNAARVFNMIYNGRSMYVHSLLSNQTKKTFVSITSFNMTSRKYVFFSQKIEIRSTAINELP